MMEVGPLTYINEVSQPTLWQPVMVIYSLLAPAGAGLLIMAALAYLTGRMARLVQLMLVLGVSIFLSVLLGPLADMWNPRNNINMITSPHLFPTERNPGFSLIALYAIVIWPLSAILSIAFLLTYNSYYMYLRSRDSKGFVKTLYNILSLRVKDEASYARLTPAVKVIALLTIIAALPWTSYPAILLSGQMANFLWRNWLLLPLISFVMAFLAATALTTLAYHASEFRKQDPQLVKQLSQILSATSISFAVLIALQLLFWSLRFGGSPFQKAFEAVTPFSNLTLVLSLLAFILSIISLMRTPILVIPASLIAIIAAFIHGWNAVINAQLASRTGLKLLELHLEPYWFLLAISPIAGAVLIFVILSSIFPLGMERKVLSGEVGGE